MIRVRTRKLFFLLLIGIIVLYTLNRLLLPKTLNYLTESINNGHHHYPRATKTFLTPTNPTLTLNSKCLCQPEHVTITLSNETYTIDVHNVFNPHTNTTDNFFSYNLTKNDFERLQLTCDLYKVLRRGPNQSVVSYSLEANDESFAFFKSFFILNIRRSLAGFYNGWVGRVYYDGAKIGMSEVCSMECASLRGVGDSVNSVDFCDVSRMWFDLGKRTWDARWMPEMTRRWLPIGDGFVDVFVSRDVYGCTSDREMAAVGQWINDKSIFHTMRDHHTHTSLITPGLWGFMLHPNRQFSHQLFHLLLENTHLTESNLLDLKLWPLIKSNSTVHDSYHCSTNGGQPFPNQRQFNNCYIGMFGCCGALLNMDVKIMECPLECRKNSDWLYC